MSGLPELLTSNDFSSPLLFKLYRYLRIIHRIGIGPNIRQFFSKNELTNIINTLKNCPDDSEFRDLFKEGVCENKSYRNTANMTNRVDRTFESSFINKHTNQIIKKFYPNEPTKGEIDTLECLLYKYSSKVFQAYSREEYGFWDGDGSVNPSFKKKELQLIEMNKLFCNMGNRINNRKETLKNTYLTNSMYRTDATGNKIYEDIPKNEITNYLGGKKIKKRTKHRKTKNKRRLTIKNRK